MPLENHDVGTLERTYNQRFSDSYAHNRVTSQVTVEVTDMDKSSHDFSANRQSEFQKTTSYRVENGSENKNFMQNTQQSIPGFNSEFANRKSEFASQNEGRQTEGHKYDGSAI